MSMILLHFQEKQKKAITNFLEMVKPGGILLIDHRNYDAILDSGVVPAKNIYYNVRDHSKFREFFLCLVAIVIFQDH